MLMNPGRTRNKEALIPAGLIYNAWRKNYDKRER
jgi:hypothetical protein